MIDTEKQQEKNYVNMYPAWRRDKQIIKQQQAYIEQLERDRMQSMQQAFDAGRNNLTDKFDSFEDYYQRHWNLEI
jgi:hypothetical protein